VLIAGLVYDAPSPSESSRRFRRELLRRVQVELVQTASRIPSPAEQSLLAQVADIVRRCETDLLNSFDASTLPVPSLDGSRRSSATQETTPSRQATPFHEPLVPPTYREDQGMLSPLQTQRQQHPAHQSAWPLDPLTYQPEPTQPVLFNPVYWEHLASRNEWDQYALIPPVEDSCGEENFADFQGGVGMWTQ
jgi:hypothetical protein